MAVRLQQFILIGVTVALAQGLFAETPGKRALLIGINDYSASRLPTASSQPSTVVDRGLSNLDGTLNDVRVIRELLVGIYGFKPADIVELTDQQATREAILRTLERHLVGPARKGDTLLFYFSGHGSQVRNSLSDEDDRLDESLIPADSRLGADDIRDKELRRPFNRILDRGARLTVILDACHSGSGARGLDGGHPFRGVKPHPRDAADRTNGPRPEQRGALVLSASQDLEQAFELLDERGEIRGAFSWALSSAIRDAEAGEPASHTFTRAQARLRTRMPAQDPVIAGNARARLNPFLGVRKDRRNGEALIAVESRTPSGTYRLQGGWANGLTVGSELRVAGADDVRLEIVALDGLARSEARLVTAASRSAPPAVRTGALLRIVRWAAPPTRPLRVWLPRSPEDISSYAVRLREDAARRGLRWIIDPTAVTPTHLLRWRGDRYELVVNGVTQDAGSDPFTGIPAGSTVFAQFPATQQLADSIGDIEGVEVVSKPRSADYLLAGRLAQNRIEYAWIRPHATVADAERAPLPLLTAWTSGDADDVALALRDLLMRLRRVHSWHALERPSAPLWYYELALRRIGDSAFIESGRLEAGDRLGLVLRARRPKPAHAPYARYVYAFIIDSHGRSVLLFPRSEHGSVENRLPLTPLGSQPLVDPPPEIVLSGATFEVAPPFGKDTYFLLTTEEPLPTPSVLEWDPVRAPQVTTRDALEALLASTAAGTRGDDETFRTSPTWSLEKLVFESAPRTKGLP